MDRWHTFLESSFLRGSKQSSPKLACPTQKLSGVPQESVLGNRLFVVYTVHTFLSVISNIPAYIDDST